MSLIFLSAFKPLPSTILRIKTSIIPKKNTLEHFKVFLLAFVNLDSYMMNHFVLMVILKCEETDIMERTCCLSSADPGH